MHGVHVHGYKRCMPGGMHATPLAVALGCTLHVPVILQPWKVFSPCRVDARQVPYQLGASFVWLLPAPDRGTDIGGMRMDFVSFNLRSKAMPLSIPPLK